MPTRLHISEKRVSAATIRRPLKPEPQARVNVACPEATVIPVAVLSAKKRTLHFLPGYAPDLNPDELVWSHTKRAGMARPRRKDEKSAKRKKSGAQLDEIRLLPGLVRPFFKAPCIAYITNLGV